MQGVAEDTDLAVGSGSIAVRIRVRALRARLFGFRSCLGLTGNHMNMNEGGLGRITYRAVGLRLGLFVLRGGLRRLLATALCLLPLRLRLLFLYHDEDAYMEAGEHRCPPVAWPLP